MLSAQVTWTQQEKDIFYSLEGFHSLSEAMVENAVGFCAVPLGIAPGLLVNQKEYQIPLATEEPSVIAALSYAARILARAGGITARPAQPLTKGQVFLECTDNTCLDRVRSALPELEALLQPDLASMTSRGGGFREWELHYYADLQVLETGFWIDTRDSMGANLVNTLAEKLQAPLEKISRGGRILSILSNCGQRRLAEAEFSLPLDKLPGGGIDAQTHARRIVLASQLAQHIPDRAVTHNKGIMNGVSALALATGNDTRALEAAVHSYAARDGQYRGLTIYQIREDCLKGSISLPVPLATVGGAVSYHPGYTAALKILGDPDAAGLGAIAAAVGLAQNFAALLALTGPGLQQGHMALHAGRLAWRAGARGREMKELSEEISRQNIHSLEQAQALLHTLRSRRGDHA